MVKVVRTARLSFQLEQHGRQTLELYKTKQETWHIGPTGSKKVFYRSLLGALADYLSMGSVSQVVDDIIEELAGEERRDL